MDFNAGFKNTYKTNQTNFHLGDTGELVRNAVATSFTVTEPLTPSQTSLFEKYLEVPIIYKPQNTTICDHAVPKAMRQLTRDAYERIYNVSRTKITSLVIGSAHREIKQYYSNPAINFYIYGRESKDYGRIIKPALEDISKALQEKIVKNTRVNARSGYTPPQLKRYSDIQSIYDDYMALKKMPPRIHTNLVKAETLIFEDSIYEFDEKQLLTTFEITGANEAIGYCILPLELYFNDMPSNRLYRIIENGDETEMVFYNGYSEGYHHKTHNWSMLLRSPVIKHNDFKFSLVVEITARVGPFAVFRINRTSVAEKIVRPVSIPDNQKFLRVLDIMNSVELKTGHRKYDLKYLSVNESEFFEIVNFYLSIDEKSMSVDSGMTFVRRRANGASLVAQELLPPWDLPKGDFYRTVLTAYTYALLIRGKTELILDNLNVTGIYDKLKFFFKSVAKVIFFWAWPIVELLRWLFAENLTDKLVLTSDGEVIQRDWTIASNLEIGGHFCLPEISEKPVPLCPLCAELYGQLDRQHMCCHYNGDSYLNIEMTLEEIEVLKNELVSNDCEWEKLKAIKDEAANNLPKAAFKKKVKCWYIMGGPGTGKSHIVRKLADRRDLIYAPFSKLRTDYKNIKGNDGIVRDLQFFTTHRGMRAKGVRRLFIDEFTSLDWRLIQCVIQVSGCEEVYLVGDHLQTKVDEPTEGQYIGNHVDLDTLSRHELRTNFRCSVKVIKLLNRMGYSMECAFPNDKENFEIKVVTAKGLPEKPIQKIGFSHNSCVTNEIAGSTVRSHQGSTYDTVALYITRLDGNLLNVMELVRVAISRQTTDLYIVTDESEQANTFIQLLGLDTIDNEVLPVYTEEALKYPENPDEVEEFLRSRPYDNRDKSLCGIIKENGFGAIDYDRTISSSASIIPTKHISTRGKELAFGSKLNACFAEGHIITTDNTHGDSKDYRPTIKLKTVPLASISDTTVNRMTGSNSTFTDILLKADKIIHGQMSNLPADILTGLNGTDIVAGELPKYDPVIGEEVNHYTPYPPEAVYLLDNLPEENNVKEKPLQTCKDALNVMDTLVRSATLVDTQTSLNQVSSTIITKEFRNGKIDEEFILPINQRGHPQKNIRRKHKFSNGQGLHFNSGRPGQILNSMAHRYVGVKDKPEGFCQDADTLAKKIVEEFFSEHVQISALTAQEVQVIMNEYAVSMKQKHYKEQYGGIDNPDARTIRMHIKEIFKPKMEPDVYKAGQGISAWSKDAMLRFGGTTRLLNLQWLKSLKSNVIYDNRMTEKEFRRRLREIIQIVPEGAQNAMMDQAESDANQNEFTQALEKWAMRLLGCSEMYIADYFSYRANYKILAQNISARAEMEKTSGEPGTLLFNSWIGGFLCNYFYKGTGPSVMSKKGDDVFKRQVGITLNEHRLLEVRKYVHLKLKVWIDDAVEFCGNTIVGSRVYPNVVRKMQKLAAKTFDNYAHFCKYQQSLRDWILQNDDENLCDLLAVNAKLYSITYDEARACYECVQSASHISEKDFEHFFPLQEDRLSLARADGKVEIDL